MNIDELSYHAEDDLIKAGIERIYSCDDVLQWATENGISTQNEIILKKIDILKWLER